MKFTIDRFEGESAVIELQDQEMVDIPKKILPPDAKEGDIILVSIDKEEILKRSRRIENKFRRLLKE